ncbi:MAG: hypothetical protein LBQ12_01810, partial [Deltaproteobacteria bacterium]|nr:hypothetical protein [Deltaproteobacteria bacterium]
MTTRTVIPGVPGYPPPGHSGPHRAAGRAARRAQAKAWLSRAAGEALTPAFAVRALFVAGVAAATVYFLGQPDVGEFEAGERAGTSVWSDRTLEVPDPVATELDRVRAESSVVPIFVQDDVIPSTVMDDTRRVFREGRRLVLSGAPELPGDFVADFYAVFHAAASLEAAHLGIGGGAAMSASAPRAPRPASGTGPGLLASAAPRTTRGGRATPAPPPGAVAGAEPGAPSAAGGDSREAGGTPAALAADASRSLLSVSEGGGGPAGAPSAGGAADAVSPGQPADGPGAGPEPAADGPRYPPSAGDADPYSGAGYGPPAPSGADGEPGEPGEAAATGAEDAPAAGGAAAGTPGEGAAPSASPAVEAA